MQIIIQVSLIIRPRPSAWEWGYDWVRSETWDDEHNAVHTLQWRTHVFEMSVHVAHMDVDLHSVRGQVKKGMCASNLDVPWSKLTTLIPGLQPSSLFPAQTEDSPLHWLCIIIVHMQHNWFGAALLYSGNWWYHVKVVTIPDRNLCDLHVVGCLVGSGTETTVRMGTWISSMEHKWTWKTALYGLHFHTTKITCFFLKTYFFLLVPHYVQKPISFFFFATSTLQKLWWLGDGQGPWGSV